VCMYVRLLMETFTLIGVISRHSEEVTTTVYEMVSEWERQAACMCIRCS
jgi:hypothetical protein